MKVTSISYQKTFNLGNYSSERLGVEVEVGEHEYADDLMKEAKELVEKMHRDGNPGLYITQQFDKTTNPYNGQTGTQERIVQVVQPTPTPDVQNNVQPLTKEQKQEAMIQNYIATIKIANSQNLLHLYTKIIERYNHPELTEVYNNKLSELQKQPITT